MLTFINELDELRDRLLGLRAAPQLSMISVARMDNVRELVEDVINNRIPGDLIECGVWRGGTTIFMRAILEARNVTDRKVFVADSFCGFPTPKYNWDKGATFLGDPELKVPLDVVKRNFENHDLLDDQVIFVDGYFSDTLPKLNNVFALIRLDGDLFESTIDALTNLYDKLSIGGYIIVDDYGLECCSQAVDQFRSLRGIGEKMTQIDEFGVYWKKNAHAS